MFQCKKKKNSRCAVLRSVTKVVAYERKKKLLMSKLSTYIFKG